jgi:glutaminyl-tRNA synthetase
VEENLDLFRRMRAGEFPDGAHVLRGKIDMSASNMLMRDPVLYRIRHAHHFRQGDAWCIYPLYDYAHCLEDAFEDVTHSICTMEFENNREIYDWVLDNTGFEEPRPHQYEWAGLDLEHAVLSKRLIKPLVDSGLVSGWDDPRLATIAAYRRRGVPPEAIRALSVLVGVSKASPRTEESKLDFAIREALNAEAPRVMAVMDPLKLVLTGMDEDDAIELTAPYFPADVPREGTRPLRLRRELWIDRDDFMVEPPAGFRRLSPGKAVRLRHGPIVRCDEVVRDEAGHVVEIRCSHDVDSIGGKGTEGWKARGAIHWVAAADALDAEVRVFGPLLRTGDAGDDDLEVIDRVDPESLRVVHAKVEPSVLGDAADTRYQFERTGYFWRDPVDSSDDRLVFNRIVPLKSSFAVDDESAGTASKPRPEPEIVRSQPAPAARPRISEHRQARRDADPALQARFERYRDEFGLSPEVADLLSGDAETAGFFEEALRAHDDSAAVAGWVATDLRGLVPADSSVGALPITGAELGRLARAVAEGVVSRRAGKQVLERMVREGGDPEALVEEMGLTAVADEAALVAAVEAAIEAWPDKAREYREGNARLIGLFVGEVMKATGGAADPRAVRTLLEERLGT